MYGARGWMNDKFLKIYLKFFEKTPDSDPKSCKPARKKILPDFVRNSLMCHMSSYVQQLCKGRMTLDIGEATTKFSRIEVSCFTISCQYNGNESISVKYVSKK
jgi:hypothetical protein